MNDERKTRVVVALVVALTTAHLVYYLPRVVDDMFISLRYAENLVHGRGLVYNAGERIEGFSNPLWVLLQAVGLALRVEGVLWTKLLGVASLAAVHVGLYRLCTEVLGVRGLFGLVPNLALAGNSYVVAWTVLGLETPLHLALIVWCLVMVPRAAREGATRGERVATGALLVAMTASRPEGFAWALLAVGAELVLGPRAELVARGRRLAAFVAPAGVAVLLLLLARRVYYDDWVPHTYYAKAANASLQPRNVVVLWLGPRLEAAATLTSLALLCVAWIGDRRRLVLVGTVGLTLAFVASVEADWMPSLRHFLPLLVVAPLGLAWAASALCARGRPALAGLPIALAVAGASSTALLDMRSAGAELTSGKTVGYKTREKLSDALDSLRRVEPPHVAQMDEFSMGMVTQNFRVLEASSAPMAESWYVGRDIGALGYYTDVKVFETAGLFTPLLVEDEHWRQHRAPSEALLRAALQKKPIAIEWFEWAYAAGAKKALLAPWVVTFGLPGAPVDLELATPGPEPAEILRRYERSLDKFPRSFLLATLYGESVGGAMARRTRIVRDLVRELEAMGPAPEGAVPREGTFDAGALSMRGCTLTPARVHPGEQVTLRCWLDVLREVRVGWRFFVHFVDPTGALVFGADHTPPLSPPWKWARGQHVRDFVRFTVPPDGKVGTYGMRIGLYLDAGRASAAGPASEAGDRLIGPFLEVVR